MSTQHYWWAAQQEGCSIVAAVLLCVHEQVAQQALVPLCNANCYWPRSIVFPA